MPRTARTIDLAVGERREGAVLLRHDGQRLDRRTAHRWSDRSASGQNSAWYTRTCCEQRSSWPPSTLASHSEKSKWQPDTPTYEQTTVYDRRRQYFDRHAAYVVVAFVAGG